MGSAKIAMGVVLALISLFNGYVAFHFQDRFRRRHHPLSITAATRQLWPIIAAGLCLHPALKTLRALIWSFAFVDGLAAAAMVFLSRRIDRTGASSD